MFSSEKVPTFHSPKGFISVPLYIIYLSAVGIVTIILRYNKYNYKITIVIPLLCRSRSLSRRKSSQNLKALMVAGLKIVKSSPV